MKKVLGVRGAFPETLATCDFIGCANVKFNDIQHILPACK